MPYNLYSRLYFKRTRELGATVDTISRSLCFVCRGRWDVVPELERAAIREPDGDGLMPILMPEIDDFIGDGA